jgi:hypothetical protein
VWAGGTVVHIWKTLADSPTLERKTLGSICLRIASKTPWNDQFFAEHLTKTHRNVSHEKLVTMEKNQR